MKDFFSLCWLFFFSGLASRVSKCPWNLFPLLVFISFRLYCCCARRCGCDIFFYCLCNSICLTVCVDGAFFVIKKKKLKQYYSVSNVLYYIHTNNNNDLARQKQTNKTRERARIKMCVCVCMCPSLQLFGENAKKIDLKTLFRCYSIQ